MYKSGLTLMFLVVLTAFSCSTSNKDLSFKKGGDIWFRSSGMELKFDSKMNVEVFSKGEKIPLNVVENNELTKPSHYIVVDGNEVTGFAVDYNQIDV